MASFVLAKRATLFAAPLLPLALLLFASPTQAYGPNGEEDRCTQLGAACLCGETFNTNSYVPDGSATWWNPGGTTGTKQCDSGGDNGYGLFAGTGINATTKWVAEANLVTQGYGDRLPTGNQVTYVFKTGDNDSHPELHGNNTGAGIRRMCQRYYFMRDKDDTALATGCKDMEIHLGSNCQNIHGNANQGNTVMLMNSGGGSCGGTDLCAWGNPASYGNPMCTGAGNLTQQHCIGHWCRAEFCVYGALTGTGNVYWEGYVVQVNNPSIRRNFGTAAGAGPASFGDIPGDGTGAGGLGNKIWSGLSHTSAAAAKLISHSMQAAWSTDSPGVFIGPAVEIEGGGSGSPPPPPAPTAPAAPVLLP